jgi:hypothetical protein
MVAYALHLTFPYFSTVLLLDLQPDSHLMVLQEKYSVQFDDLFKIAWEDNADNKELQEGGVKYSNENEVTNGNLFAPYVQITQVF